MNDGRFTSSFSPYLSLTTEDNFFVPYHKPYDAISKTQCSDPFFSFDGSRSGACWFSRSSRRMTPGSMDDSISVVVRQQLFPWGSPTRWSPPYHGPREFPARSGGTRGNFDRRHTCASFPMGCNPVEGRWVMERMECCWWGTEDSWDFACKFRKICLAYGFILNFFILQQITNEKLIIWFFLISNFNRKFLILIFLILNSVIICMFRGLLCESWYF